MKPGSRANRTPLLRPPAAAALSACAHELPQPAPPGPFLRLARAHLGGGGAGRKIDIQNDTPHRHVTPVPFRAALGAEGGAEAPARRAGGGWCLSR